MSTVHTEESAPAADIGGTAGSTADAGCVEFVRGSGNVFLDVGFEPGEAANLQLRSRLAIELRDYVESEGITQTEAASRFGVTQPRVSDLMRGKLSRFTIDALVTMLASVGRRVEMSVEPMRQAA
jgi:predicted XRE-type DNA-binding protein